MLKHFNNMGCSASFTKFNILHFVAGTGRWDFVSTQHYKGYFTK